MFFDKKRRQCKKRYMVFWDGLLEARFPDFQEKIEVRVDNFSCSGATLHSDRVFLNGHHLIAADQKPELGLKILSPEGVLESKIEIRWYRWLAEKNIFEIGIRFMDILKDKEELIDKIINKLRQGYCYL